MTAHIKYRQLKAFALVVELGSFKAAADRLAVTQPSLSALVKDLEEDLGVALLERSTRSCRTTPAGAGFYDEIKGAVDHLEDAYEHAREIGAGNRGKLSLAALPSLCSGLIVDKLAQFQRLHPGVRISLSERGHEQIQDAVRRADVEFGVGSMLRASPELSFEPVFSDHLMIVAPLGHPVLKLKPAWKSLARFPLVYMMAGPAEHGLRAGNAQVEPVFEVEQASTALAMVRQGMGVTVLPSSIVPNLVTDGLACVPIVGKFTTRQLGIIRRRNSRPSASAAAFAQLLRAAA
ncbi:MAG: LysR family regulatory protein [Ramlibacter sp.]|jgi:LysR family carnitine catabolism transcriptional activator|nr:LysR family regulatory protein [Ramlibacter sp.]